MARSSLALTFGLLLAWAAGVRLVLWRPRALWVRSLAGSTSLVLTFYALTRLPAADVLTLSNTFPIWIAILSWPLEGVAPGPAVWLAACCGVGGVYLIQQPTFDEAGRASLFALGAAFFSAIAMLGLHRIREVDPRAIVVQFSLVASLVCIGAVLTAPVTLAEANTIGGPALGMMLGMGLSATVGQVFLTKAFAAGPPTKVAVVGLAQIVFALLLDVFLQGHGIGMLKVVGIALVAAPTAWLMAASGGRRPPVGESLALQQGAYAPRSPSPDQAD